MSDWKKEIARDSIALGSILFYAVVVIRSVIGEHWLFFTQLVVAGVALFLLSQVIKNANMYLARGVILAVFTSLFYNDSLFTIFAFGLLILAFVSLNYLKVKRNVIFNSLLFGIVSTVISSYASPLLV